MNYKLDYISLLFQKASSKRIEHYVITRIWHLLDSYEIKMTPQQYVSRKESKYALTDVYFPQIGFHIEVNEPAHYDNDEKIQSDNKRNIEIEKNTGHRVFVIDCRKDLTKIHTQINELVTEVKNKVEEKKQQGTFKPWNPENEHNPEFWKEEGKISISDEVGLHTIEDICLLFDADYKKIKRGFLSKGGITHPKYENLFLWWPAESPRSGWRNEYDESKGEIIETHSDVEKKTSHYNQYKEGSFTRVVFIHYKNVLGITNYKYVGVFKNDTKNSSAVIGTVWSRFGKTLNLKTGEVT